MREGGDGSAGRSPDSDAALRNPTSRPTGDARDGAGLGHSTGRAEGGTSGDPVGSRQRTTCSRTTRSIERAATLLFRAALRLYPSGFRERFGARMVEDFIQRGRHAWLGRGRPAAIHFWIIAVVEILPSAVRVRLRERRGWTVDLKNAARSLRRSPGHTAVSVVILALGVAGSALVFSVLYGLLLRPLPYTDWDRTLVVWSYNERQGLPDGNSYLNMQDWAERSRTIDAWAWYYRPDFTNRTVTGDGEPRRILVGSVSASFFPLLGVDAVLGRPFTEAEERDRAPVVVLSHALWADRFGRDPAVIGRALELDGSSREIVGVMSPELELPRSGTLAWEPHSLRTGWPDEQGSRHMDAFVALARLAPGATLASARNELRGIAAGLQAEHEENRDRTVLTRPLLEELTGAEIPRTLWLFQAAAALVLIAVGSNLGHLWLVRALGRRRDFAVRLALGAGRRRLIRLICAEGLLTTTMAAALGLLLALLGLSPLLRRLPASFPRVSAVTLDPAVVAVTLLAALVVGGGASLIAAVVASRVGPAAVVGEGGRSVGSGRVRGLRAGFVVVQMALATVLVASAGLFVRSVARLETVNTGMDPSGVLVTRVELSPDRFPEQEAVQQFADALLTEVRAGPGVLSAGITSDLVFRRFPDGSITPEGHSLDEPIRTPLMVDFVSTGFLETMRMPVLRGRTLEIRDRSESGQPRNVVLNETAARTFWPGQDALGKRFQWGTYREDKPWHRVVGVVTDSRRGGLHTPAIPQIFAETMDWEFDLAVRVVRDPMDAVPLVREAVSRVDPSVAVASVQSAESLIGRGLDPWRLRTWMALLAAGLVVALAMLGMYGLLNESVQSRRFEIGVRVALGAEPGEVGRRVLARGVGFAMVGVALGVGAMGAAAGVLSSFVFGVGVVEPLGLGVVVVVLLVVTVVASWVPARRATRVDPVRCLAGE